MYTLLMKGDREESLLIIKKKKIKLRWILETGIFRFPGQHSLEFSRGVLVCWTNHLSAK